MGGKRGRKSVGKKEMRRKARSGKKQNPAINVDVINDEK